MKISNFSELLVILISTLLFSSSVMASNYSLFNPTPGNKLRPLTTERSSRSDSVNTINPGHVQVEASLFSVGQNKDCNNTSCQKTHNLILGDTTMIRIGSTENSEIQVVFNTYTKRKTFNSGGVEKNTGFGDTSLRFKYSFSGNQDEKFGVAITPFVKLPTGQNGLSSNTIEGGVALPLAFNLIDGWSVGGMSQLNFLNNAYTSENNQRSLYQSYTNAIYLTKNFNQKLYGFVEYSTQKASTSSSKWQNTANLGLHYFLNNNLKIDAGINLGLNQAAENLNYYSGFAYRF